MQAIDIPRIVRQDLAVASLGRVQAARLMMLDRARDPALQVRSLFLPRQPGEHADILTAGAKSMCV
jgi:hypothetical protein